MDQELIIIEKHPRAIRWSHWLNFPILYLMVWSGILIYWAHQPYVEIPEGMVNGLNLHHRLAEGMGWHFFLMWIFTLNGLFYVSYLILSGEWRELVPGPRTLKQALPYILYDLKLSKNRPLFDGKFNPVQRLAYSSAIFLGLGSLLTGFAIYKPVQLGFLTGLLGGYEAARLEHFVCMVSFVLFFVVHVLQVARAGWNNFRAMIAGYEIEK